MLTTKFLCKCLTSGDFISSLLLQIEGSQSQFLPQLISIKEFIAWKKGFRSAREVELTNQDHVAEAFYSKGEINMYQTFIWTNRIRSDSERALFALPARLGGLALTNPVEVAQIEYSHSLLANKQLADSIVNQHVTHISDRDSDKATKKAISLSNNTRYEKIQADLKNLLPPSMSKMLIYASEKGASSWLTSLPLEKYGYVLSKQYFQDAICLRYNFLIPNRAVRCICGELNTVDHTLICKRPVC